MKSDTSSRLPYYQTSEFEATLGGQKIRVISKPGLPEWNYVTPSAALLAELVPIPDRARVLLLGCGHGALGAALARQAPRSSIALCDTSIVALTMAARTLARNGVSNARIIESLSVLPEQAGSFDIAVIDLPIGRAMVRRWLVEARAALRPGGQVYLAGANEHGIRSAIDDAEALCGPAVVLGYKKGHRAVVVTLGDAPPAPAWSAEPGIAPGTWHEIQVMVRGDTFQLASLPGVFAYEKLDEGTALLLEHMTGVAGARVLDAGCGYGVIGIIAARMGAASVDLVDSNLLAVASSAENITRLGVQHARAMASDAFAAIADQRYDLIVSNPPFHAGKEVDYDVAQTFIEHARLLLNPGGRLLLVANRFIRYDHQLRAVFPQVEIVAETSKFHVLSVVNT